MCMLVAAEGVVKALQNRTESLHQVRRPEQPKRLFGYDAQHVAEVEHHVAVLVEFDREGVCHVAQQTGHASRVFAISLFLCECDVAAEAVPELSEAFCGEVGEIASQGAQFAEHGSRNQVDVLLLVYELMVEAVPVFPGKPAEYVAEAFDGELPYVFVIVREEGLAKGRPDFLEVAADPIEAAFEEHSEHRKDLLEESVVEGLIDSPEELPKVLQKDVHGFGSAVSKDCLQQAPAILNVEVVS